LGVKANPPKPNICYALLLLNIAAKIIKAKPSEIQRVLLVGPPGLEPGTF
tara:strand:+ start:13307 stop:13456 length:150 start_codon:yes stop_codon:yes gene_type:complete